MFVVSRAFTAGEGHCCDQGMVSASGGSGFESPAGGQRLEEVLS